MTGARELPRRIVLLGSPVRHSLSPRFQGAAIRAAGIAASYEALDVPPDHLAEVVTELVEVGVAGNVTIPHKRAVFELVGSCTDAARRAEAVNTFWVENGVLWGDNTDVAGFDAAVGVLGTARARSVIVLLGAGGAASAVCLATEGWSGARVFVASRRLESARALAQRFAHVEAIDPERPFPRGTRLVVNATPVGMTDAPVPCDLSRVPADADVMDLVYRRGETAFVRQARARGHRAMDGREMLLQQGAKSFERWFGQPPDIQVMREAVEAEA